MFHLLLCVTENIKQSHAVRGGRFRIEFQPGQGNLDHTHGDRLRSRPRNFSPFFPVRGSGSPSPTTESDQSAPVRPRMGIDFAPAHATFPLSFQSMDPGHPPRLQSPTTLHPYVATKIKPTSTRRVKGRSTRWSNQV